MRVWWVDRGKRWATFALPPLIAIVVGVAVVVASSPASLTRDHRGLGTTQLAPSPSPGPVDSPSPPTVTQPGILGSTAHLEATESGALAGEAPAIAAASADGGKTWTTLVSPGNDAGIAIDPSNPMHAIAAGGDIRFTNDGGKIWQKGLSPPPGRPPYQVLRISPFDGSAWFFIHQGSLLRTRDGSATWRELPGLPTLSSVVLVPGSVFGEFFLASTNRLFQLVDNGQQITELPPLPSGLTVAELAAVGGSGPSLLARTGSNALYVLKAGAWSQLNGVASGPIGAGSNGVLLVGNGGTKLNAPGLISYSVDGGTTWHESTGLPYDQTVEAIAGLPSSTSLFAYCFGGDVYASTDGGGTWSLLSRYLRSRSG